MKLWNKKYEQSWRESLGENDEVDVKHKDGDAEGWRIGKIKSTNGDTLYIILPKLGVVT